MADCYVLKPGEPGKPLLLQRTEREVGEPGAGEISIRVTACALNYRDLLMLSGKSASSSGGAVVPLSDGAGIVEAAGEGSSKFKIGDRVAGCFFRDWVDGPFSMAYHKAARGGSCDGMLAESVVGPEDSFVAIPDGYSDAEAACLPCAALTAWHALFERGRLEAGQTVLVLGTGGLSIWALQLAAAAGARVIVTSSSDEKLEKARDLGAWKTINYRHSPEWSQSVKDLTEGRGVDHVIEVGGPGTFGQSLNSVAAGGRISLIGVLTGFSPPEASLFPLVTHNADVHGIYVGSRVMFLKMNAFLERNAIRPVIDRTFEFSDAALAYEHLRSGAHLGKVVITA
ncbi:MAG: NAD(P)-dependent alcohol dehydrogenase [Verrucomicrobiae bacterium]|nr:NAD(P)-dependent alcohol dehydrogenase [Verrucomicrobiae bacterium]